MQRHVLLCRHAETHEPYPLQPDFDRELTKTGIGQARNTGQWIREHYRKVDLLLASPAKRSGLTARLVAEKIYFDEEKISYDPELYNARESRLLKALAELPDSVTTVLVVAHNPGITALARTLTDKHIAYMEPADVIAVALDLEKWEEIYYTLGHIQHQAISQA
ncbi:SixA phosphatase family protein [Pontibacter ruber]|uniref:SixA phosphatase family protein n=1 Tax=Pontibacter ruber TaxID=1343895 RepID=A0ABW5CS11_9BACT|nr:histidine phosphatase family protein [Pontibacter ruber]